MYNEIIRAYMLTKSPTLSKPYMEKEKVINEFTLIVSIYKCVSTKRYFCQTTLVNNGEYMFNDAETHSCWYDREEVSRRDIISETIKLVSSQILMRRRLLTFISNNKSLPSILGAAFNQTLIIYTKDKGKLKESRMYNGLIRINLPANEQVYLRELMEEFGIKVDRNIEELTNPNELYRT